jgi:hypothetical protein
MTVTIGRRKLMTVFGGAATWPLAAGSRSWATYESDHHSKHVLIRYPALFSQ